VKHLQNKRTEKLFLRKIEKRETLQWNEKKIGNFFGILQKCHIVVEAYNNTWVLERSVATPSTIPGTDVMILKIFSTKNVAKKLAFLTQNKAKF
jgi:hypothetical protein